MEKMNYSPWMTQYITEKGLLERNPLCIVDVGASGGIASYWNAFGKFLKAVGFEPLIAECARLNAEQHKSENVTYFPYCIVADDEEVHSQSDRNHFNKVFKRSSAIKAAELKKVNYVQKYFNDGKEPIFSDQRISIDNFFSTYPMETIDFIKIDTDGHDYEVLHGAKSTLANKQVLGVTVESIFHGKLHNHSNVFRNIDRLLTDAGFVLFDLEVYRYTKQDLPGSFLYPMPAQTTAGQVLWGEALYFRDCCGEDQMSYNIDLSPIKLLKLACLFELFGLPDCSAELLNSHKEKLSHLVDVQKCLDLLIKNMGTQNTYDEYIKKFEQNFENFYPAKQPIRKNILSRLIKKICKY